MSYFKSDTITYEAAMADLAGGSDKAKIAAASALGEVADAEERKAAASALIEVLGARGPLNLRAAAARSLGELGQAEATHALAAALEDTESTLRQVAALALGRLGLGEGFEVLRGALTDAPPDVRFQAARSLVEIDPERALEPLLAAIADEKDAEVIGAMALGLGEIGDASSADAIAAHLDSSRDETKFEVAYSLAMLGDARGVDVLIEGIGTSQHAWDAIEGLELAGDADAADALAAVLEQRRIAPELPIRAAGGLLAIAPDHPKSDNARAALLKSLSAWKHHLRGLAVSELGRVGGSWAVGDLKRLRGRRRGAVLLDEIDEALEAIAERESSS